MTYADYVPTWTGFSANPTAGYFRAGVDGKFCHLEMVPVAGTSNSTSFTFSLPFAADAGGTQIFLGAIGADNGAAVTTPCRIDISGSTATVYKDASQTLWTASGAKNILVNLCYKLA
jgi:hypothetical protein